MFVFVYFDVNLLVDYISFEELMNFGIKGILCDIRLVIVNWGFYSFDEGLY